MKNVGKYKQDGKYLYSIEVCDKCMEDIPLEVISEKKLKCFNCKYSKWDCNTKDSILRRLDCRKYAEKLEKLYIFIITFISSFLAFSIFVTIKHSLLKALLVLWIAFNVLDIVCSVIEDNFYGIREIYFYRRLCRLKIRRQKELKEEEVRKEKDEFKKASKDPFYRDLIDVENCLNKLKKISDNFDFGKNRIAIEKCVEKLFEILELLKEDSSTYSKVAFLFEVYLPEFYNTLKLYTDFIKKDEVTEEYEKILTECVKKFSQNIARKSI